MDQPKFTIDVLVELLIIYFRFSFINREFLPFKTTIGGRSPFMVINEICLTYLGQNAFLNMDILALK